VKHRLWILSRERFGDLLLGPNIRVRDLALHAFEEGWSVSVLAAEDSRSPFSSDIEFTSLRRGFSRRIATGDRVVVGELLPSWAVLELLRARQPFHWDVYGLSLPESLSFADVWPRSKTRLEARRKDIRYLLMAKAATRIWVSHPGQVIFLSALLARTGSASDAIAAFRLPEKILEVPMGCSDRPVPSGTLNPYHELGIHAPVFMWGGGIWRWFDPETVLQAFSLLRSMGVPATLFFISGRNEATSDYQAPLDEVVASATRKGLLDGHVVFNPRRVGPSELGPWLGHCRAGIMGNMPTLESRMSWRTRYLDLLWAGKPLVVSGADPLAERMERRGAALITPASDPSRLADAIQRLVQDNRLVESMSKSSRSFGDEFSNKAILAPAMEALEQASGEPPTPPGILDIGRYLLGI